MLRILRLAAAPPLPPPLLVPLPAPLLIDDTAELCLAYVEPEGTAGMLITDRSELAGQFRCEPLISELCV